MSPEPTNADIFFDFVELREQAREAKQLGVFPHSEDTILNSFSFCNINRNHDRVTRWIDQHVRRSSLSLNDMVFNLSVARVFNSPDSLRLILPVKSCAEAEKVLLARQARKESVFRGAYMMPSHGTKAQQKVSPITYYLEHLRTIQGMDFTGYSTLEGVAKAILGVHGFGTFITNQIVTDLRYTRHFKHAPDWSEFVWGGPGTSRGLCRFFNQPKLRIDMPQPWIHERLMEVRGMSQSRLPETICDYYTDPNNLSNSFCEYDKYMRVLKDEGGRLRKYKQQ